MSSYTSLATIPHDFYQGSIVSYGNDIYLIGGSNTNFRLTKYNIISNSYTSLAPIPYNFYQGSAVIIGTNIFIIGGGFNSSTKISKYNILTNVWENTWDFVSPQFYHGSAVAYGTDIYLFGSNILNFTKRIEKINSLSPGGLQETIGNDIPFDFGSGSAVIDGSDVYLIGSSTYPYNQFYKYNIITKNWVTLENVPSNPYGYSYGNSSGNSSVIIDKNIYSFGPSNRSFRYSILNNTWEELENLQVSKFQYCGAVTIDSDVYLFGSSETTIKTQSYLFSTGIDKNKEIALNSNVNIHRVEYNKDIILTSNVFIMNEEFGNKNLITNVKIFVKGEEFNKDSSIPISLYIRRKPINKTPYRKIEYEYDETNPIIEKPKLSQYDDRENSLNDKNKLLLSLLGMPDKNNRNIGTEDFFGLLHNENMDFYLNYINDKFDTILTTLSTNKSFSLTKFENKNYHEIIGKLKTVKIQSRRGNELHHLMSLENPQEVAKEQLMSAIESYYDSFELYTKCKYNLTNLEKVLRNKVDLLDFEIYKKKQQQYYDDLIEYLEELKKIN